MRKHGAADVDGDVATAVRENGQHVLQVQRVTTLPSHAHLQETMDGVDVVVTTPGRGTFLIRERKDHPRSQCPLLRYEIRRIATGGGRGEVQVSTKDRTPRKGAVR